MPAASRPTEVSMVRRFLPLFALAAAAALILATGTHKLLTFKSIGLNYEVLQDFIARNRVGALALFMLAYIALVALSLPGAVILSLSGGLLFGWQIGAIAIVIAATAGATILFQIARTSFGETLAAKAGPWLVKLQDGFRENAFNYLLFLRLVPVFPFVVVNLAAALLGMPLRSYVIATMLGIIPGTIAYAFAGAGLGSVIAAQNTSFKACLVKFPETADIACPYTLDTSKLITSELLIAFVLLGLVALVPVVLKKWSHRNAAH